MERSQVRVGMQVRVTTPDNPRYDGQVGVVKKLNPTNVKVELPGNRLLNAHPMFLTADLDASRTIAGNLYEAAIADLAPALGTVVEHTGNDLRIQGPYVVIGEGTSRGHTIVKIAKLGGDGNRYWRVAPRNLRVIKNFGLDTHA
jgi:hypothetical protein